jgi:hypothetical protein
MAFTKSRELMKLFPGIFQSVAFTIALACASSAIAQNQTATNTPVIPDNGVPFTIDIEQANFSLPSGLQSYVVGTDHGQWLLLAGRINGLHGFNNNDNNFPPDTQNTTVFVVDPKAQTVVTRSLTDAESGLTQAQIDILSATGSQFYQSGDTLYISGGYGVDTATTNFTTKDCLSAINIPGLIHWVNHPSRHETAAQHIHQAFNSIFQVTGGVMAESSPHHALLMFGDDFEGPVTPESTATYTGQIRRFAIFNVGNHLDVFPEASEPAIPDTNYFRSDLNVVPTVTGNKGGFLALSGVFTPQGGIWTVPVEISQVGVPTMADPNVDATFKQGMNNFTCPVIELHSHQSNTSYTVLLGGISYGFFSDDTFETDSELPFINQVTTIKRDPNGVYTQYLMNGTYPVILSTNSNPGNQLLFGAGATFIPAAGVRSFQNGVIQLDHLERHSVVIGYIVGGIQSTLPNTVSESDTASSPYIFTVTLIPALLNRLTP